MTFDQARSLISQNVRIWPFWDDGGDLRFLLQRVGPKGEPLATIGSCKAAHAQEYIGMMMRGLEVGAVIAGQESAA